MTEPAASRPPRTNRQLLLGAATLAIATALPQMTSAQSFQGSASVEAGGATVNTSAGNTTVNINAPVTVINWQPTDTSGTGEIAFQSAGTTALFQSINFADFAVLNRILPVDAAGTPVITRPIRFDGTVNSQFGAGSAITAGSVWFYTPGGIVLGSSAAFNVGSLVLSTSTIASSNVFVGDSGTINFTGTPNVNSAIRIENGAAVSALLNGSSYIAMVAPRVEQNGTVQVDGSVAYVGAEAADITMDGGTGLFDISVSTGTSDANGVVHGELGATTGPGSVGVNDPQRIYMMAIPKNTAISMLVNGNVGYTPAASATVQNGEVVLSAGYNIANGTPSFGEHAAPANALAANINIGETTEFFTTFSSRVRARASGNLLVSPGSNGTDPNTLTFTGSAILWGDVSSIVEAIAVESVVVGGDLFVASARSGQGGNAAVRAIGGLISVGRNLTVDASSIGFSGADAGISLSNLNAGNGRGGAALIDVANGNLSVNGTTQVSANGVGGFGVLTMGNGFGGAANVSLNGANATALFTGGLDVQGNGSAVIAYFASLGVSLASPETVGGGNGSGGSAAVSIGNINQLILPTLTIASTGVGDAGGSALVNGGIGAGNGGIGAGGSASLILSNEALVLPELIVDASGIGGAGGSSDNTGDAAGNGGAGIGGTATIALTGAASLNPTPGLPGSMAALAAGMGGDGGGIVSGGILDSGSGGAGTGGTASISIGGASQVSVGNILAFADGTSGNVGTGGSDFGGTNPATGGNASVLISTSGTVDAGFLTASADALTYQTSRTADATAGSADITLANGALTVDGIIVSANASLRIESGQNVGSRNGMSPGNSVGGAASLSVTGGTLAANETSIAAFGRGSGQNPNGDPIDPDSPIEQSLAGGDGVGGSASFSISAGSASIVQPLLIDASGRGGDGYINSDTFTTQPATSGAGGAGVGGSALLDISGGLLTAPVVDLRSDGTGGNGGAFWGLNAGDAGGGGNGIGGVTSFTASQDIFTINSLTMSAAGNGGVGGVSADPIIDGSFLGYDQGVAAGGIGGTGQGGSANLTLDFDPVLASLIIDTSGIGGFGGYGLTGGAGGNGFGGIGPSGALLTLNFGNLTVDSLIVRSNGAGGAGGEGTDSGGAGGNGTGGDAAVLADGAGSNLVTLDVLVQANGLGGNGGLSGNGDGADGGSAQGGSARLTISNAATGDLGLTVIEALADGGAGGSSTAGFTGGNGGNAVGGGATLAVTAATANSTDLLVQANGRGGGRGVAGTDGVEGNGTGGSASVSVTTGSYSNDDAIITANGRGDVSVGGNAAISAIGGSISFTNTVARADGEIGPGSGGLVSIFADTDAFGTSGTMALGIASLSSDAFDGVAGVVRIDNDNANAVGGIIQFDQLSASADGFASTNPVGGVYLRSNQSDIAVTGNATLFARDSIGVDGVGQGTFAAGGAIFATAGTDIVVTHSGQPGLVDTVRGTIVSLSANRNLDAQPGSIIRGTDTVDLVANFGFANVDQLFATNAASISAALDASLRNANVSNGSLNLRAGFNTGGSVAFYQLATANLTGAVTSSDSVNIFSGGDIVVSGGADIRSGNVVTLNSGDDIIIRNSAITSAQNVTSSGEIQLNVGTITPVDAIPGEIRSLVVANSTLSSPGFGLVLAADAIDATTGIFNGQSLTATVNNAPPVGVTGGNDGGLLSANCVQGNICLGALTTPTQIQVGPATGSLGLANRVTLGGSLTSNNISIRARDGVTFAGPPNAAATNNLLVSVLNGPIDLTGAGNLSGGNSINLYAGAGGITGANAALVSGGNIGLFANGEIALGSIDTAGVLNTIANDGSVTIAGSLVTPGNVTVGGLLAVRGGVANINSGGAITTGSILTTAGNDVLLTSVGAQSLGDVTTGRDLIVNAASLAATSVTAARNLSATVSGSTTLGNTSASLITLRAGQDVSFTGTATAATALNIGANGQAAFNGTASAPSIDVRSGNILIGAGGRLGTIGTTQNVVLTNSAGGQMTIGGGGVGAGYSLSDAEIARIFGNNIDISWTSNLATTGAPVTPPAGGFAQPSVIVGSLTLSSRAGNAAGNLAANGTLSIRTPGAMQVNGAVVLNGAGAGNRIDLFADQLLQVIAGQGSVAIRDSANALAGTLDVNSANIVAASASAITDIAGLATPAAVNIRLGSNDGFFSDSGLLSAGVVNLNGGDRVLVQNSGATIRYRDRRGISANAINVSLTNPNGLIVINGQITSPTGFSTGLETIPLLSINGTPSQTAAGYDPLSTMNGCQIAGISACRQQENPISVTEDDINQPLDPDQAGESEFPTALIELKDPETFGYPPLIDEPVTGSGNDDLWPATCKADEENCPTPVNE